MATPNTESKYTVNDARDGHHGILLDGEVQITGCYFNNNKQVATAVKRLNQALLNGEETVTLCGSLYGTFDWNLEDHNHNNPVFSVNVNVFVNPEEIRPRRIARGVITANKMWLAAKEAGFEVSEIVKIARNCGGRMMDLYEFNVTCKQSDTVGIRRLTK